MKINRKNSILVIILLLILVLILNNIYSKENFQDSLDNVDGMEEKMDELTEMEKETRMFCKILRHDEDKVVLQDLLNSRNKQFQQNWMKQNKLIADIKKKFIKLRLEKDGRNLINFNDKRNTKYDEIKMRKKVLQKAKDVANSPYKLDVNINNNSS